MKTKKFLATVITVLMLAALFAGCKKKSTVAGGPENVPAALANKPRNANGEIVLIATTENAYPPYSYIDESGKLAGFDVEVVREIAARLKPLGYELEVKGVNPDVANMVLASHATDVFFDEMSITPERLENFHFSIPYYVVGSNIVVREDETRINGMKDLEGRVVGTFANGSWHVFLQDYNAKTAKTPIKFSIIEAGSAEQSFLNLQNGKFDARLENPITAAAIIKNNGLKLKILPDAVMGENIALMFQHDAEGEAIKALIDPIIAELGKDGTLERLAKEYAGDDYFKYEP